ncbi:MAG: LamG domain-containing protein [Planctomycetota bacterium]
MGSDDFSDPCNWNDAKNLIGGRLIVDGGPNHPAPLKDCNAPIMSYTPDPCYAPRDLQGPGWDANSSSQWYITGGSLYVGVDGWWRMGYNPGTIGYTKMTGGELVFDNQIYCPYNADANSTTVDVHGGTIRAGSISFRSQGLFDFEGDGKLILDGDVTGDVVGWVLSGNITAYGGSGTVESDYNVTTTGKTTIWGTTGRPKAGSPYPAYNAQNVCPDVILSWVPGDQAATVDGHDIYFGTSPDDINVSTADPCVAAWDMNSWEPPTLEYGETYHWRIVEVNDTNTWEGDPWKFTVEIGVRNPNPADGSKGLSIDTELSWTASCLADSHEVFFGTDYDDVNNMTVASATKSLGDESYDPGPLDAGTWYYWRVDEVGDTTVKGKVWSFKTGIGLLLYYRFNGTQGSSLPSPITDDSGNGIEFTKHVDTGSVKYGEPSPIVAGSASAEFVPDAGLYRAYAGENDILNLDTYQYTIELWFKVNPGEYDSDNMLLIGKGLRAGSDDPNVEDSWSIMISDLGKDDDFRWYHDGDDLQVGGMMTEEMLDEWIHVGAVYDQSLSSNRKKLYINGILEETGNDNDLNTSDNNDPVGIGCEALIDGTFGRFMNGFIDEVRIHDIALTPCDFLLTPGDEWASCPDPYDKHLGIDPNFLAWNPGDGATSHDVYIGTDHNSVRDATPLDAEYVGTVTEPNFPASGLLKDIAEIGGEFAERTYYFWRIDEINGGTHKGLVWRFRTTSVIHDANMVLWYALDETDGDGIAVDYSGYENHGNVDEDDMWDPTDGKFGGSLGFDDDNHIGVPDRTTEDLGSSISISCWLKDSDRPDTDNWVFGIGDGAYEVRAAVVSSDNKNVEWRAGNDGNDVLLWNMFQDGYDPSSLEGWHHWVFVKDEDAGTMKIYFDNVVVESNDVVDQTLSNVVEDDFTIGAASGHSADLVGRIDDFRVFIKALTDDEVKALFRGGEVNLAWSPNPINGQMDVSLDPNMTWKAGDSAETHDLYFGTDLDAVTDANSVVQLGVYIGNYAIDANIYNPVVDFPMGTTYYWRVDEVNTSDVNSPWKGNIWSFTTSKFLVIDDFESYIKPPDNLWYTWENPHWTGSFAETGVHPFDPVNRGNQSMKYGYDITEYGWAFYAEVERWFASPQDWDSTGVKMLTLSFYGHPDNDANSSEQMSIGLEDSDSNSFIDYDGDMNDIKIAEWQEWNIALSDFTGVDMTDVRAMYIRFGDAYAVSAGGSGTVYMDDIRLYPPKCVPSEGPAYDWSGNCIVDFGDVKIMGSEWLKTDDLVAVSEPLTGPVGHWEMDEGDSNTVSDSSGSNYHGTAEGSYSWVTGKIGSWAIDFTGGKVVVTDDGNTPLLNPASEVSITAWVNYSQAPDGYKARVIVKGIDDGDGESYGLQVSEDDEPSFLVRDSNHGNHELDSGKTLVHDEWMHLAGVYDGNDIKVYVNGGLAASNGSASGMLLLQDVNDLAIGDAVDVDREFPGAVDDARVYDYGLTDAEVAYIGTENTGNVKLISIANIYDDEPIGEKAVNFRDFAVLMNSWLVEQLWPL